MSTEPTGINWPLVYSLLFIAQWIVNVAVGAWLYLRKEDGGNAAAIANVKEMVVSYMEEHNVRMTRLESDVRHLPTAEEMSTIREDVAATKARTEAMTEALRRVEHQTNLIHEHLLARRV